MFKWLIKLTRYVPVKKDCRFHKRMIAILLKENAELKKSKSLRNPDQSINSKKSPGCKDSE